MSASIDADFFFMLPQKNNKRFTLNKSERLKSRKIIQSLFIQNKNLRIYPFKLVWLIHPSTDKESLKIGVSVSKRYFKSAVKRNRIKRVMRECLRLNKFQLLDKLTEENKTLSLMLIYTGSEIISHNEFSSKIKHLLIRLGDKINY